MRKHIYIVLLFSFLWSLPSRAQTPHFTIHPLGELYRDVKLNLLYEDHNSLLWLASSKGLFRYDGLAFEQLLTPDSLSQNQVRSIFRDSKGVLWVGYQNGLICHLENRSQLWPWNPEEGIPAVPITGFTEDPQGVLWIATYGEGLYYWKNNRLYNIDASEGLLGNDIYVLAKDQQGRIWAGTDGGISICSLKNDEKKVENITRKEGLPDDIVYELIPDDKGKMWIGMYEQGVCRYDPESRKFDFILNSWSHGIVNKLALFEDKELWIGTNGEGVYRLNLASRMLRPVDEAPDWKNAKVFDLHKDIEGNIWVISNTKGLCSANRQFEYLNTEIPDIQAVLMSRQNQLWIGTNDGLFWYDYKVSQPVIGQQLTQLKLNILSLFEDTFGNIWIGTFGQGVYCYDPRSKKVRHVDEADGLTNGSVLSMAGLGNQVWLATLGGVTKFVEDRDIMDGAPILYKNYNDLNGLGSNFIYKVFIDSQERIWFGTDGKGLSVLENGELKNFTEADSVNLKTVYTITEDQRGHIWLSTSTEGIFEYDGKAFHHLASSEGIRNLAITSMAADEKGNIIIVHPSGIDLLDPVSNHLIYYDTEVGITDIKPNLNAISRDQEGNVWIGSDHGIIKYTALNEQLSIHPRTQITQVNSFLDQIDFLTQTTFSYNQNHLTFHYIGLWYTDPATVVYRCQLVGYDLDWKLSKDREVSYSRLPPGDYVFKVQSTENESFAHEEPVESYAFTILAPFWRRAWFLALIILALGGIIYTMMRIRERGLERTALLKKEKIESQFEILKSQINPHFLFNSFNTLITIIEENPDLAVEYVEHLSDYYRSIIQYREKEVISLQEEIELVKNFKFLLQKRFGENLQLHIHTNGQQTYVAPLTLQMLIENAVKHNVISKSRPLTIDITTEGNDYVVVRNNIQKKIREEKSTRFGLQSIKTRYEVLSNKPMKIEETASHYKVSIPLLKNDM